MNLNQTCDVLCRTSFDVKRRKVGGNGHNRGGSHLLELFDRVVDDNVATTAAPAAAPPPPAVDAHLIFGDAPVTRFIGDDAIVELNGTIKSSSVTFD